MRKLNRILALCLIVAMTVSMSAFAAETDISELNERFLSDLGDIERVYKYDLAEGRDQETEKSSVNVLKYHSAVQLVTSLKIMSYLGDGNFDEDKYVRFNEFSQMILQLSIGSVPYIEEKYSEYGETRPTKMGEAAYYLVEVLGYHVYESQYKFDNPRYQIAKNIGLFRGVSFYADKLITRGELACMIANALEIDLVKQTSFGERERYDSINGNTLLQEQFSAIKLEGVVTAVPGMSLFASKNLRSDTIEIDRVCYQAEGLDCSGYLGRRVLAVIKIEDGYENIISIGVSEKDKNLRISLSDICMLDSTKLIYYNGEKEEKIYLGGIKTITRNGETANLSLLSPALLSKSGELILCSSSGADNYDIAAVRLYEDFVIKAVSGISEQIFLAYGQTLNGNNFIKADIPKDHALNVMKNGEVIPYTSLKAGDVITITANDNFSIISMVASEQRVNGKITETEDDKVLIGNNYYAISDSYRKSVLTDDTLPELKVRTEGTFFLSFDNRIVGYKSSSNAYHYGYFTKMQKGRGLEDTVQVRIFNDKGEWGNYYLAKKLTFDGDVGTARQKVYDLIMASAGQVFDAVIRFDLNGNNEITFLDTARIKNLQPGEVDLEARDLRRVVKADEWSGTYNWQKEGVLTGSPYLVNRDATVFKVPKDKANEELYTVTNKPKFGQDTRGNLILYSLDEFNMIPVMVESVKGGQISADSKDYFVVMEISRAINQKGDEVSAISCLNHSGAGKWEIKKFFTGRLMQSEGLDMQKGDLICYTAIGDEIQEYIPRVKAANINTDFSYNLFSYPAYALGTITGLDEEAKLIKFRTGTNECVCTPLSIGLYLSEDNKGFDVSIDDLRIGDRIYAFGAHKTFSVVVLR